MTDEGINDPAAQAELLPTGDEPSETNGWDGARVLPIDSWEAVIPPDEPDGPHLEPLTSEELATRRERWRNAHLKEPNRTVDECLELVERWSRQAELILNGAAARS
jgi:hypothetical protein